MQELCCGGGGESMGSLRVLSELYFLDKYCQWFINIINLFKQQTLFILWIVPSSSIEIMFILPLIFPLGLGVILFIFC